jgi:hypothetical protein
LIKAPVIIIGAPRSGTTLLYRCLALHRDLWCLPAESHEILEGPFHPAHNGFVSNRVVAADLDEKIRIALTAAFDERAINLNRVLAEPDRLMASEAFLERVAKRFMIHAVGAISQRGRPRAIRLVEKTPKNTLRVNMLAHLFPDARFVWLRRETAGNVRSIVRGWHARDGWGPFRRERYATYPIASELRLRDYSGKWWKFALVPEWRSRAGTTVADVAAWQHHQCLHFAAADLALLDPARIYTVEFEPFVQSPVDSMKALLDWCELERDPVVERFAAHLPRVNQVRLPNEATSAREVARAVDAALHRLASQPIPQTDSRTPCTPAPIT